MLKVKVEVKWSLLLDTPQVFDILEVDSDVIRNTYLRYGKTREWV